MGALHAGHVSLIEAARRLGEEVVVSVFVNPTQFRPGEDFERYPRTPDDDIAKCEAAGADYVFLPGVETMYPAGPGALSIHVAGVGDQWEGPLRPGHFDGVATVVTQLFLSTQPNVAVFSVKDLQQCAVVTKLVAALRLGVKLHLAPTVREADGLAMSSRNRFLSKQERAVAPQLYQGLLAARDRLRSCAEASTESILADTAETMKTWLEVQYLALVNQKSMEPTEPTDTEAWLIVAAKLGSTRLIDSLSLFAP